MGKKKGSKVQLLDIRVVCKVKDMKTMGLVPSLEFLRINSKSPKFSYCLSYHTQKSVAWLLKIGLKIGCPTRMGGPS